MEIEKSINFVNVMYETAITARVITTTRGSPTALFLGSRVVHCLALCLKFLPETFKIDAFHAHTEAYLHVRTHDADKERANER